MILTPMKPCMLTTPSSLNTTAKRNYKHHKNFKFPRYCGSSGTVTISEFYSLVFIIIDYHPTIQHL